jgi:hypothetical protein
MMSSNQTMKATPKRGEMVIPGDPRIGIGLNMVPEPGGFKQRVRFKDYYPPKTVVTISTATDSKFEHGDGAVPFRSVPFRSVPFRSVLFRSVPFRSVPFRSVSARVIHRHNTGN